MPDTIANPYGYMSPIGNALAGLSRALVSGPTEAQRIYQAEQALKAKREREGVTDVAGVFRNFGTDAFDRNRAMSSAILGGYDPDKVAAAERYSAANTYGVTDPRTTNAFVGAGGSMASSPGGFAIAQQNEMERARMKPTTVGGPDGPVIVPQQESYGMPAVEDIGKVKGDLARRAINAPGGISGLPQTEQRFIGAERAPAAPHNYVANGQNYVVDNSLNDVQTGQPAPRGGFLAPQGDVVQGLKSSVQSDLQKQNIANQRFRGLLDYTRGIARQDANNFGVTGIAKGLAQDATQIAGNVAQGLGFTGLQDAVENVRTRAMQSGVNRSLLSGVFDPKLPALHTAADLMIYVAAEALAGQSGRQVSDRDVQVFRNIVGDPREWFGNQEKFLSKLDTIEHILDMNQEVTNRTLRSGVNSAAPPAPSAAPAPAAAAPQSSRPRARNPQTGQVVEFDGQSWVPAQ